MGAALAVNPLGILVGNLFIGPCLTGWDANLC